MEIRTLLLQKKVGFLVCFLIQQTALYAVVKSSPSSKTLQLNHTHLTNLNKAFRFLHILILLKTDVNQ